MVAENHYDDDALISLLRNRMSGDTDDVLIHVESCETCQSKLETISRSGMSWEEVSDLLKPDDASSMMSADFISQGSDVEAAVRSTSFLESSDYPGSLGRFDRYEITEMLGRGGMGIVMRAFDSSLNRYSAIKVLAPELACTGAARSRFSREAKNAAAVVHPHVVPIQTVDEHNGLPYLVMPVVEGQSLEARVRETGPLPVIEAVRIAAQIGRGLAAAHEQGLVHRDIKPANVLLENGVERVQITDFGLARAIDDASMTRSGVICGTPQYMSPEQAHGDAIDHRSDLFSLGSLTYFMLTGHSPFRAETTMGVLNRICNDEPRSIRSINVDVPEWLEQIVGKLLAKSPDERFQSAAEVSQLLEECQGHLNNPTSVSLPASLHSKQAAPRTTPLLPLTTRIRAGGLFRTAFAVGGLALLGILAMKATDPPDITGSWQSEQWGNVELRQTKPGSYAGTFHNKAARQGKNSQTEDLFDNEQQIVSGGIEMKWSRLERRYNGAWKESDDYFGKISLKLVDEQIRGARTTSSKARRDAEHPRLSDFTWSRASPSAVVKPVVNEGAASPLNTEMVVSNEYTSNSGQRVHQLYATASGDVTEVVVNHGDVVNEGDVLIRLRNVDLEAERTAGLVIRSPVDGVVITRNLKSRLAGRPIRVGDALLEVATSKTQPGFQSRRETEEESLFKELNGKFNSSESAYGPLKAGSNDAGNKASQDSGSNSQQLFEVHSNSSVEQGPTPRAQRWIIEYDLRDRSTYARQLDFFGIELGCLFDDGRLVYAKNFADEPTLRESRTTRVERRLFSNHLGRDRSKADHELLINAGIPDANSGIVLHFYEPATEQLLANSERDYAQKPIEQIRRTWFQVRKSGRGYQFVVVRQEYHKARPKASANQEVEDSIKVIGADEKTRDIVRKRVVKLRKELTELWGGPLREKIQAGDHSQIFVDLRNLKNGEPRPGLASMVSGSRIIHHGTLPDLLESQLPELVVQVVLNRRMKAVPEWLENGVSAGVTPETSAQHWDTLRGAFRKKQLFPLETLLKYSKVETAKPNAEGKYEIPWDADKNRRDEIYVAQSMGFCQFAVDRFGANALIEFADERMVEVQSMPKAFGLESLEQLEDEFSKWLIISLSLKDPRNIPTTHVTDKSVGNPVPDLVDSDTEGNTFRLSNCKGKVVVLLFAQGFDDDYQETFAPFRKVKEQFKTEPVRFVAVLRNSERKNIMAAKVRGDLPWTVIPQPFYGRLPAGWGVKKYPTVCIIDKQGVLHSRQQVVYKYDIGFDTNPLVATLQELLQNSE